MSGAHSTVKQEVGRFLATGLFFSTGFCLILVSERLVTRGSGIEVAGFFQALYGGLIVAAVLRVVDLLPFFDAFLGKPLLHNIVWKSSLYVAASLVYRYVKPLVKFLFHGLSLPAAASSALQEFMLPRRWAIEIWVAMLLVVYVTMMELVRVIGRDRLKEMFFGPGAKPSKERYSSDAALKRVLRLNGWERGIASAESERRGNLGVATTRKQWQG